MSLHDYSPPGHLNHAIPQIIYPPNDEDDLTPRLPTRPPLSHSVSNLSAESTESSLSTNTVATTISTASGPECKSTLQEEMYLALFGKAFHPKPPHPSTTPPTPWTDTELLQTTSQQPKPKSILKPPTSPTKPPAKVRFLLSPTPTPSTSNPNTLRPPTIHSAHKTKPASVHPTPKKRPSQNTTTNNNKGTPHPHLLTKTLPPHASQKEGKETHQQHQERNPNPTPSHLPINMKPRSGHTYALGIEGLKGLQNIKGPNQKGLYFHGMGG
ncbi:hypothetical protein HYALB_00010678 [Hymenoscyphus albidus]|uniref:Uncharacterized protein n=1 Tax=Hymenoscyphus albidus TaxID=595503 RepID=A0A9N9Q2K1_9HELO|nr:hypothetical protein HYALB_00010678 [Hymenoscyphus albidus]